MGDNFKTCELHGKPFPHNLIDTNKNEMARLYVERKTPIEGKSVTLTLFVGDKTENEGIDVCGQCLQEKILSLVSDNGIAPVFKGVTWQEQELMKKDGSGTYKKNTKVIARPEEIAERIKAEKKNAPAPTTK